MKATAARTNIPFVDLRAQYETIKTDVDAAIARVVQNTSFILGPEVKEFEAEFATFTGFKHVIGVANGTEAIHIVLRAMGLAPGDEVVAPAHTFTATTEGITHAGGSVRLADVDDETFCMTADTLRAALTTNTKLVVPVPIYGNPAGLDGVIELAREAGVRVMVDAAQAHGARLGGKPLGELVDTATYSFYPGKNLGAYGDGGAIATNDDEVARLARMWRNHGREGKFDHTFEGYNSRLDGLQAAILRAKLPHLQGWGDARRQVAGMYRQALDGIPGLRLPVETAGTEHVYHLYVVRLEDRDGMRPKLGEYGVSTGVHYPLPIHLFEAYRRLGQGRGSFPVAEGICEKILSLPMFPEMTQAQVDQVAGALRETMT
jgi:dTDP-4-amino-4,6-dideoxygalactose transaminase